MEPSPRRYLGEPDIFMLFRPAVRCERLGRCELIDGPGRTRGQTAIQLTM